MDGKVKHQCQAVVIRVAPDPSAGEMLNVGVVLHAPGHRYLGAKFTSTWKRITDAFPDADRVHLGRIATAISRACDATYEPQLKMDEPPADIVTAVRRIVPDDDASLLISAPLTGLTSDPERTLKELFDRYVVRGEAEERKISRNDNDVWREVSGPLRERGVLHRLQVKTLKHKHYEERFDAAWKNGQWNVARPLSLDLVDPQEILHKAAAWTGRIRALDPQQQKTTVVLVVGLPHAETNEKVRKAGRYGLDLLREQLAEEKIAEVVVESDAPKLAARIARDLEHKDE